MLFNSYDFAVFAPVALIGAALLRGWALKLWLIACSYVFYGWMQPVYCTLLLASTVLDYTVALRLAKAATPRAKKLWLAASLVGNLGMLGFFKYADFALGTVNHLTDAELKLLAITLPAGISFYTFQTLSYTIDVYRGKMQPTTDFLTMALYVSFFPQLVAGPIERGRDLMPQLHRKQKRSEHDLLLGITRILWGLMKKIVFADWLASYTAVIFGNPEAYAGWDVALAVTCFAFVIYLDFSSYSDIAIGLARCMGIKLRENFKHPYLARNISEFWRRWHISLSEWLRDYLYIPLGGSRKGTPRTLANLMVVMFLGGLWHGADWAFVLWGLWHGLGLVGFHAWASFREKVWRPVPREAGADGFLPFLWRDMPAVLLTFAFVWVSWALFASQDLATARVVFDKLLSPWGAFKIKWPVDDLPTILAFLCVAVLAHIVRGLGLTRPLERVRHPLAIGAFWGVLILTIALLYAPVASRFIYFQF